VGIWYIFPTFCCTKKNLATLLLAPTHTMAGKAWMGVSRKFSPQPFKIKSPFNSRRIVK
jgi:hypothetical protein